VIGQPFELPSMDYCLTSEERPEQEISYLGAIQNDEVTTPSFLDTLETKVEPELLKTGEVWVPFAI
jgi:hypothetical protein